MGWLLDQILGWLTAAIVTSLDEMFKLIAHSLLITPDVTGLPQVQALTGRSTWVVDTVFVLAFIAVGAITMGAGSDERARYTAKDLAPRLVVGFIAAHFSQLLCAQAIGVANGLVEALYGGDRNIYDQADAIRAHIVAAGKDESTTFLFMIIICVVAVLVATTAFGLVVRLSVLLVLATIAPLALACHALPHTDPVARLWWRSFGGCLITPVLQAFCLQAGVWMLMDPAHSLPVLGIPGTADPGELANLFVVLVLMWTTVKVPGLVRRYVTQSGRTPNWLGMIVRVVIVQQITRGLGRGAGRTAGRGVRAVAR